jgi:hypothetical protein
MMSTYREPPPDGPASTTIQVNVDGLASFRAMLNRELQQNLRPGAQRIIGTQEAGPGFGRATASLAVQDAHGLYADALSTSTGNLATYVQIAQALIDVIHDVIQNYSESDLTADILNKAIAARMSAGVSASAPPVAYPAM